MDRQRPHPGFSLIELLVVIAIIAATAGLVYAVLGPVRERARRTVCASNLHQISKAISLYRSDYDGADVTSGPQRAAELGLPRTPNLLDPYLRNRAIWRCPDEDWAMILGAGPVASHMFSSYYWEIDSDETPGPHFSDKVGARGELTPLLSCPQHDSEPNNHDGLMFVNVARLSGSAEGHLVNKKLEPWRW